MKRQISKEKGGKTQLIKLALAFLSGMVVMGSWTAYQLEAYIDQKEAQVAKAKEDAEFNEVLVELAHKDGFKDGVNYAIIVMVRKCQEEQRIEFKEHDPGNFYICTALGKEPIILPYITPDEHFP